MELLKRFALGCNQAKLYFTCGFVGQFCYCSVFSHMMLHKNVAYTVMLLERLQVSSILSTKDQCSWEIEKRETVIRHCIFECILYNCNHKKSNLRVLNGRHAGKLWIQVQKKQRRGGKKAPHNFSYVVFPRHSMQPVRMECVISSLLGGLGDQDLLGMTDKNQVGLRMSSATFNSSQ